MELLHAKTLCELKMKEHGVDYSFKFINAKKTLGNCNHSKKVIGLSKPFIKINNEEIVLNTILHEIAHALCPIREGHGYLWKHTCRKIGAIPVRLNAIAVAPTMKYTVSCEIHGELGQAGMIKNHKAIKTNYCRNCWVRNSSRKSTKSYKNFTINTKVYIDKVGIF